MRLFPSPKNRIMRGLTLFKDFNSSVVLFWKPSNTRFNKTDQLPLQISMLSTIIRLLGNDPINQDLSDWNFWNKIHWHVLNKLPKSDIYCKSKCNANDFISSLNPSSGNFQCRQVDTQLDKMNSDGAFSISISLFVILLLLNNNLIWIFSIASLVLWDPRDPKINQNWYKKNVKKGKRGKIVERN